MVCCLACCWVLGDLTRDERKHCCVLGRDLYPDQRKLPRLGRQRVAGVDPRDVVGPVDQAVALGERVSGREVVALLPRTHEWRGNVSGDVGHERAASSARHRLPVGVGVLRRTAAHGPDPDGVVGVVDVEVADTRGPARRLERRVVAGSPRDRDLDGRRGQETPGRAVVDVVVLVVGVDEEVTSGRDVGRRERVQRLRGARVDRDDTRGVRDGDSREA